MWLALEGERGVADTSVSVTGACASGAETYAGDRVSYIDVPAGGSKQVPLDCGGTGADGGTARDGGDGDGGVQVTKGAVQGDGGLEAGGDPPTTTGCACSTGPVDGARAARNALGAGVLLLLLLLIGRNRGSRGRRRS